MEVFTIEVPDSETKFLKEVLKKINGRILKKHRSLKPNKETLEAMSDIGTDNMVKFGSVKELFDSI